MPVSELFSNFANKAQTAIGSHLPSGNRPTSPDASSQPSANDAAGGHSKNHTLEALQYQIRSLGQQYSSSTTPAQRLITLSKGVAIDLDSHSRDAKAYSKELYTWGQTQDPDLKDVSDRLAYLNFVQGSLATSLSEKLNAARAPLKSLRDAETALAPRRQLRATLNTQLTRLEHENSKGTEKKIADIKEQIKKAEEEDQPQEREIELLKRKALRESEQLKWEAIREYAEKLAIVSQAAPPVLEVLPVLPPTTDKPYSGGQATGAARASLQRALDNYKLGLVALPQNQDTSSLSRRDTLSFGESHADELEYIGSPTDISQSAQPGLPMTPPAAAAAAVGQAPSPAAASRPSISKTASPSIDPSALNQAPAPIPSHVKDSPVVESGTASTTSPVPIAAPKPHHEQPVLPPLHPTVAETGSVISTGASGPGPSSGSLKDIKHESPINAPKPSDEHVPTLPPVADSKEEDSKFLSAEEEKKRLAAEYSAAAAPVPKYEQGPGGPPPTGGDDKKPDELPPSYQDY